MKQGDRFIMELRRKNKLATLRQVLNWHILKIRPQFWREDGEFAMTHFDNIEQIQLNFRDTEFIASLAQAFDNYDVCYKYKVYMPILN